MAKQTRIEFNTDGFREILMGDGVKDAVESVTTDIQERANGNLTEESEGFRASVWQGGFGGGRWIGTVSTTDLASKIAESEDKALSRAVIG